MRRYLLEKLLPLLDGEPGIVVIHSSIAGLGPPAGFTKWDLLYALNALIARGWTVALPAFTFGFCGSGSYDYRRSRPEVGVLADWFLEGQPDAVRTPHPIYSFAVAGPAAERIAACVSSTTFGDDSPFGLFEREKATLMMLGCDWKYGTQFHRYEEKAAVPYRHFKDFQGRADYGGGEHEVVARMYVRDLDLDPANDFTPAEAWLRSKGLIRSIPAWRGRIEAVNVSDLAEVCTRMLADDPMAFVARGADLAHRIAARSQAGALEPLRVAVLGSTNVARLRAALESELPGLLPDRRVETCEVPYGQLHQQLLDPASELRAWRPNISIFCDRLEDLLGLARLEFADAAQAEEAVDRLADAVAAWHAAGGGWTIVHRFASLYPTIEPNDRAGAAELAAHMNERYAQRLSGLKQVLWVDTAAEAAAAGAPAVDFRLWHLGRMPYSEPFSRRLARVWSGKILASLGKSARVIVLDLDNTLWGGVLGEEGIGAVQLGGDFPGNAFQAFQRALGVLKGRGIGLAVCSKNDEDAAIQAIDNLPGMQFRSTDLVAHRINWRPKHENLRELAAELNLGWESLIFIDDNPVEREQVRRNLPGVKILELPDDPAAYVEALAECPWLGVAAVTEEDLKRTQSYRARRMVEEQRAGAESLEDFYAGLGMKLHFQPLDEGNAARAAQLCMKTNQFNTTTRRYEQPDLRQIVEEGGEVIVIGLADRFSELENIGLLILRRGEIEEEGLVDSYLLSCRVLGRGLESAVLHWARGHGTARGWKVLRGAIIETERNTPVRGVFRDAGFQAGSAPGEWIASSSEKPELPPWLEIFDHTATQTPA
ncbi:MAG TPA: HAD-IIIC family phosphatase [Chthoniobacterales bacterium]|nr:HAD-IIIC family phosphatase [Chthoniobacterales bacterium]